MSAENRWDFTIQRRRKLLMPKYVGTVSELDKDRMIDLYEQRIALENLREVIKKTDKLATKLIKNYDEVSNNYNNWWVEMKEKYDLESDDNGQWQLDFSTGNVYLVV